MAKALWHIRWRILNRLMQLTLFLMPKGAARDAYKDAIYKTSWQIVETVERAKANG